MVNVIKWALAVFFVLAGAMGFVQIMIGVFNLSGSKIISDIESKNAPVQIVHYKPNGDSVVYDSIRIAHYKIRNGAVSFEYKGVSQEFSNFRVIK